MKKTNNKGFSLVELIIVIAIMAILAGAIAPALIKYIDKSRKSNDVSSAKTIKTAIETALGTEEVYETLTNNAGGTTVIKFVSNATVTEGESSGTTSFNTTYMTVTGCSNPNTNPAMTTDEICKSIASNIGEKIPKTKYKKMIDNTGTKVTSNGFTPDTFYAFITSGGTVYVAVGDSSKTVSYAAANGSTPATFTNCAPLAPEVCKGYQ